MSKLACRNCKSVAVEYEDYCGGTSYYRCKTCGQRGSKDKFTQNTVFQQVTQSEETLAEKLVYRSFIRRTKWHDDGFYIGEMQLKIKCWKSKIIPGEHYKNKAEAYAATVAKLKEVAE